ncbi:hypothetical protein Pmani_026839 [Petrolisthes manimaculis]|uniref:Chitin-binding type-2 domain-containing protein n=1 Tax=Petrolisthes manimaculis TaxID=1843537 RepID=A0AAE1TZQ4_9EUCA|nr:hypothetical protein Pmani_026839 [Petrolisthes manimaculis]
MVGVSGVAGYTTQGSCVPECTFVADGTDIPNPRNCHEYYTCYGGVPNPTPHYCGDGNYFDASNGCVPGSCSATPLCIPQCNFEPTGEFANLAHRTDCTKYYFHTGAGLPVEMECPTATPYFDGADCQADENKCCEPCMVFCATKDNTVANTQDCSSFYLCNKDNYFPDETDLYYCADDTEYEFAASTCSTFSSCDQMCI